MITYIQPVEATTDKVVNLTERFLQPRELILDEFKQMILKDWSWVSGALDTTVIHQGQKSCRTSKNWAMSNLLSLDIDGYSLTKFIDMYGSILYLTYTTKSNDPHTDENRFRAVFKLERTLTNREEYSRLLSGLVNVIGVADSTSRDIVKLYSGNPNAEFNVLGNTIPQDFEWELLQADESVNVVTEEPTDAVSDKYVESAIMNELDQLASASSGSRHTQLLETSMKLASLYKSDWTPELDWDHLSKLIYEAASVCGLTQEDGRNVEVTIQDGLRYADPRPKPSSAVDKVKTSTVYLPNQKTQLGVEGVGLDNPGVECLLTELNVPMRFAKKTSSLVGLENNSLITPFVDVDGHLTDVHMLFTNGGGSMFKIGSYPILYVPDDEIDGTLSIVSSLPEAVALSKLNKPSVVIPKMNIVPLNLSIPSIFTELQVFLPRSVRRNTDLLAIKQLLMSTYRDKIKDVYVSNFDVSMLTSNYDYLLAMRQLRV